MAGGSVRLWVKKQLSIDHLSVPQSEMVQIGSTGLLSVFKRLAAAQGPGDGPAKPLTKRYAIWKTRKGLGNRRNLSASRQMLSSLKLRTVGENRAYASVGADARQEKWRTVEIKKKGVRTGKFRMLTNKDVAWANQKREPWLVFSPINKQDVMEIAKRILGVRLKRLAVTKSTGINLG